MDLSRFFAASVAFVSAVWWAVLLAVPASREPFLWNGLPDEVLIVFAPADFAFIVLVPAIYAWKGDLIYWKVFAGAFGYATVLTVALCVQFQSGWLGLVLMGLGSAAIVILSRGLRTP